MNIRKATQSDIAQLTELKKPKTDEARKQFAENQIKRLKDAEEQTAVYLLAEENNKVVGHVFIKLSGSITEPDYPNIGDLFVDVNERNKSIGSQLIQEAERIAKANGYTKISLAVNPTLNPKAKVLYEKLGYAQTNTKAYIDGVYDDVKDWCIDMIKDLV